MPIHPMVRTLGTKASALLAFALTGVIAGVLVAVYFVPVVASAGTGTSKAISAFEDLPSALTIAPLQQASRIYATSHGKPVLLATFFDQNRQEITAADVPVTVKNATVAGEDVRYYSHGGVDLRGIMRAAVADAMHKPIQGASTITQQYVKNVCLQAAYEITDATKKAKASDECTDDTVGRKLREMRLAIGLEKKYTKDQILLGYLNIAGFGGQVYGVQAAAEYYFGVPAKQLSITQAAALMAVVNNPELYRLDVKANLTKTQVRRDHILAVELQQKMITAAQYADAIKSPIQPHITKPRQGCDSAGVAGFFCDYVVNTLLSDKHFGSTAAERRHHLLSSGWQVYTTLNLDLQQKAQSAMNRWVPMHSSAFDVGGASVSEQVGTGRVITMVQNKHYSATGAGGSHYSSINYNVSEALGAGGGHQPGSTAKLFALVKWLESGHTLYQKVNGNPRTTPWGAFTACGQPYGSFQFGNDTSDEKGAYTVMDGTARSVNGVFVSMGEEEDLCKVRDLSQAMGETNARGGSLDAIPSLVIGGANSVTPLGVATAYATIANHGVTCSPVAIDRVVAADGSKVAVPKTGCHRTVPENVANAVVYALRGVITGGTMAGDQPDGRFQFGKTGTTDNANDTWAVGSSSKITTAVWVGAANGHANLRAVYGFPYCAQQGSTQAAIERHCVWSAIQYQMDKTYGGAYGWASPESQFLYGGVSLTVKDAMPPAPKPVKKKPTPAKTPTPGGGKQGGTPSKQPPGGNH